MSEWWEEKSTGKKIGIVVGFMILGLAGLFFFGLVVMWLWNWLMPDIFGLPEITYWQGWGLLLLSCILFKGFGSGSSESKRSDRKRKQKLREYMDEQDGGSEPMTESTQDAEESPDVLTTDHSEEEK